MSGSTSSRGSNAYFRNRGRGRSAFKRSSSTSERSSSVARPATLRQFSTTSARPATRENLPPRRRVDRSASVASTRHQSPPVASSERRYTRATSEALSDGSHTLAGDDDVGEDDVDADEDALDEVVMAVDMQSRGSVGCCYYVAREETLYFMEEIKLGGGDIVDGLKTMIEPTCILVPSRSDETLLNKLDPEKRVRESTVASGTERDEFALPYRLEVRPSPEFAYDGARNKLVSLQLDNGDTPRVTYVVPGDVMAADVYDESHNDVGGRQGALLRLAGWINVDSRMTVGCAGAVLSYLQRRRAVSFLPGDRAQHGLFRVLTVAMFSLKDTMFINSDTLESLQIISSEAHPHLHNQGPKSSGSKEGLSVYGLFHFFARTPQGRTLLRQWFLRPSLSLEVINERHDAVATFLRPDNQVYTDELVKNLAHIKNMRWTLINLRKGVSSGTTKGGIRRGVWATLREFIYRTLKILDIFQEIQGANRLNTYQKIRNAFDSDSLQNIGRTLVEVIDYETSEEERRTVVHQGVDEELDGMKRVWAGIESMLAEVARHISAQVPSFLNVELNVVLFPQIGFLIAMPLDPETGLGAWEGKADSPWERMFNSDRTAYYKSSEMNELNEQFGDIYSIICDKEIEIIHQLAQDVLQYEELLSGCSDLCAELDCILALAQGARQHRYARPRMTSQNVIEIRGGRHPLQELTVASYVANDTYLVGGQGDRLEPSAASQIPDGSTSQAATAWPADEGPSMLLMTGPNYSGKSIYLKQIALIVYMAHVGSFVPAEAARIGLTDKILTRIATRESVSRSQSAFMIDLQQVSMALSLATHRSLLVIDEFGKGTESDDGAGLAAGVFEYLLSLEGRCPKVLGATHYHEIFEAGFLQPAPGLAFGNMEIHVVGNAKETEDQITYLYNFCEGRSTSSRGTICAAMNGIAAEVIQRAEELLILASRGEDLVEACAVMPEDEEQELKEAELIARDFITAGDEDLQDAMRLLEGVLSRSTTLTAARTGQTQTGTVTHTYETDVS